MSNPAIVRLMANQLISGLSRLRFLALLLGLGLGLGLLLSSEAEAQRQVDLQLLLAVDTSSSVNDKEFDLQMRGIAEAFRSPGVHAALQAAGDLGIAVALMQWSDSRKQDMSIDWRMVRNAEEAEAFAQAVEATARYIVGGGTAIGTAIEYGVTRFARNGFYSPRRVIDVSGDGRANQGRFPVRSRDDAVAAGVTINGLAILNEDSFLDSYYLRYVIGGTGAFVITADDYDSFAVAMTRKLIQEISGVPLSQAPAPKPGLAFAFQSQ